MFKCGAETSGVLAGEVGEEEEGGLAVLDSNGAGCPFLDAFWLRVARFNFSLFFCSFKVQVGCLRVNGVRHHLHWNRPTGPILPCTACAASTSNAQ